jgi:hypothetical protein
MTSGRFGAAILAIVTAATISIAAQQAQDKQEERPKVPKDSLQVTVLGCLKGRVLSAADVRQVDTQSGPPITQRAFRLAGKKDEMNEVKKNDGQRVEIMGLIKKSALMEPGVKFKGGRVAVGGGSMSGGGSMGQPHDPAENVVVMDVQTVQAVGGSCGS